MSKTSIKKVHENQHHAEFTQSCTHLLRTDKTIRKKKNKNKNKNKQAKKKKKKKKIKREGEREKGGGRGKIEILSTATSTQIPNHKTSINKKTTTTKT